MGWLILAIVLVAALAAVAAVAATRRQAAANRSAVTGRLAPETVQADRSAAEVDADRAALEAAGRRRAEETKRAATPATRAAGAVAERVPVDEEELAISRRQFFNRGILATMAVSVGTLGAAAIAFLYARSAGGFGGKVKAGASLDAILAFNEERREPYYVPEARTYLVPYPKEDVPKARKVPQYRPVLAGMEAGIVALYQKCPHLGCKVPWCPTSQWFECPCHASKYSRVGEKRGGPAPRGMDHFVVEISGGDVTIDTSTPWPGAPIGTDTTGQGAEGPPCVGG